MIKEYIKFLLIMAGILIGTMLGISTLAGIMSYASYPQKCVTKKHPSILEIVAVQFYYSMRLGCELVEPRFNLEVKDE